jgi:subtilisin-like proprotein convertase family protein
MSIHARLSRLVGVVSVATFAVALVTGGTMVQAAAAGASFSNPASIAPPDHGAASPSSIAVFGQAAVTDVNVTLRNVSHTQPDDLDVLLESPTGIRVMLISDSGSTQDATNLNLVFDDSAASPPPDNNGLVSDTYKPFNYAGQTDEFVPAPTQPDLAAFNGTDPNGTWKLYVADGSVVNGETGAIAGGWSLELNPPQTCGGLPVTIVGTSGDDLLVGTEGADVIAAGPGDDKVLALGGDDVVCGGDGKDRLKGGFGTDKLFGEAGKDFLVGGPGKQDFCKGGSAKDGARGCEIKRRL